MCVPEWLTLTFFYYFNNILCIESTSVNHDHFSNGIIGNEFTPPPPWTINPGSKDNPNPLRLNLIQDPAHDARRISPHFDSDIQSLTSNSQRSPCTISGPSRPIRPSRTCLIPSVFPASVEKLAFQSSKFFKRAADQDPIGQRAPGSTDQTVFESSETVAPPFGRRSESVSLKIRTSSEPFRKTGVILTSRNVSMQP